MVGENETEGIIPRTFDYLFKQIENNSHNNNSTEFEIKIAFIQIYNEEIQDLFEPKNKVRIKEDPQKGVFLFNCQWINVKNKNECIDLFNRGEINRKTEFTSMNAQSSRSHALLIINIEKVFYKKENKQCLKTRGLLHLVDLAGSERISKSKLNNERLQETKNINKSLFVLRRCIMSLSDSSFPPFHESKLTRILKYSLIGNSKTSLIVTISPSNYNAEESLSTLEFGKKAMKIKKFSFINIIEDYKIISSDLQEQYDVLMEKNNELKIELENLYKENEELKNNNEELIDENNELKEKINLNKNKVILKPQIINLLIKKNIDPNQNINNIIIELLKYIELKDNKYQKQINNLKIGIENNILENNRLQNISDTLQENIQKIKKEKSDLESNFISLNKSYEKLNDLNIELMNKNQKIESEYLSKNKSYEDFENTKTYYEDQISNIKNENKLKNLNAHLTESELKRVLATIKINEKLLNKSINVFISDMNKFNLFKKKFKKIEIIIENDLKLITPNTYESTIQKSKEQINNIQEMIENLNDINSTYKHYNYNNYNIKDNIEKLNEKIVENRNNMINFFILLNKIFSIIIDFFKKNKKLIYYKDKSPKKNNNYNIINEDNIKKDIINILMDNLYKFRPLCYNTDNSDLKAELNIIKQNSYDTNVLEVMKSCTNIFEKLILRCADYKEQREKEIKNLNNKIIYFLREIENYSKYFKRNMENNEIDEAKRLLNNQLFLKEGEIIKLNKEIDLLLKENEKLIIENKKNNFLKKNNLNINSISDNNINIIKNEKYEDNIEEYQNNFQ